jgi:acyl-coenzyme A thioesterase PaaI-like protein
VSQTDASGKTHSRIDVTATAIHQGRTQQRWQAGITDAGRRLIATGQVRLRNAGPRT